MTRFALLQDQHVVNKVEFASAAALVAALPTFARAWINLTNIRPEPNVGDHAAFDATLGHFVFTSPSQPAPDLSALRVAAHNRINTEAGAVRAQYGTDIPFQDTLYAAKRAEVELWQADVAAQRNPPDTPERYPYLNAEATKRTYYRQLLNPLAAAVTITDAYNGAAELSAAWPTLLSSLDGVRLGLHEYVDNATTPTQIASLFPIQWPGL